jgi:hypothetical protein
MMSTYRPDLWPSRKAAEAAFRKNKFFQSWDSRVLDKYIQFGLREVPTALYPSLLKGGDVSPRCCYPHNQQASGSVELCAVEL